MKKSILMIGAAMIIISANAQNNVGINTTSPQATLDVRGSQRVGGNNSYIKFDSATGRIEWVSAAIYTPVSQQIIRHSGSSEGLYAGGGRLEYRNTVEPVFYSDWTNGNGYFKNNLGIGSISPFVPLTFATGNGAKISLSGAEPTYHGFGVQGDILQVYSNSKPGSAIAFGSYFNSTFDEIMRVQTTTARVGIGTSDPRVMLHVSNGSSGVNPVSSSTLILESNSSTYMNLLCPTSAESGILFGSGTNSASGAIIFGNSFTPNGFQFRDNGNDTKMVLDNFGRLGIGIINPNAPLTFPPALGKKITLYPGATGDVGLSVQGNLLQIYSDNPNADIAFGYDQAGVMTERMRIKANGNVGIGVSSPQFPLDLNGRIQLRGTNPNDPGVWLNDGGANRAFIGLQNNDHVGFYGTGGINWGFTMNTTSGALAVNGNEGSAGQVLQSNGGGVSPTWTTGTNALYNNTVLVNNSTLVTFPGNGSFAQLPGMTYTFTAGGNTKVFVSYSIPLTTVSCAFCGLTSIYIDMELDGALSNRSANDIANGVTFTYANSKVISVGPGTHTIRLLAGAVGPSVVFNPCCVFESNLNLQVIQQ